MEEKRLRLVVSVSNKHIYAQMIDDQAGKTLTAVGPKALGSQGGTKTEKARILGKVLAQAAIKKGFKKVSFDRSGRRYHGRVKALAEGAREGGLEF